MGGVWAYSFVEGIALAIQGFHALLPVFLRLAEFCGPYAPFAVKDRYVEATRPGIISSSLDSTDAVTYPLGGSMKS